MSTAASLSQFREALRHAGVARPLEPRRRPATVARATQPPLARTEKTSAPARAARMQAETRTRPRGDSRLVTLARAAQLSGISQEEITQLARAGTVRGRVMPRRAGGETLIAANDLAAAVGAR